MTDDPFVDGLPISGLVSEILGAADHLDLKSLFRNEDGDRSEGISKTLDDGVDCPLEDLLLVETVCNIPTDLFQQVQLL